MVDELNPEWAKMFFVVGIVSLTFCTFVVVINLWGLTKGIAYSSPALITFTVFCLVNIYVLTKCKQIGWSKDVHR